MSDLHKRRMFVCVWLALGVAIVLPVVFGLPRGIGGHAGDGWRNFIYDFQTLIGGGAAIIAAWYTVGQMRITDEKSELRHRELVALQLRSDRLRIERLLFPSLGDLEDDYEKISEVDFSTLRKLVDSEPLSVSAVMQQLAKDCEETLEILKRRQFQDASDLFDGHLAFQHQKLKGLLTDVRLPSYECSNMCHALQRSLERGDKWLQGQDAARVSNALDGLETKWGSLLISFGDLKVSLELMKKEYGVH
ncbi:hypothetical protein [Agrobacterium radiobacter]|uniref:hypothetical protein n=1 Tax=Agrobacterium radiobacter TaxID=362 RepID=UPI003F877AB3